MHHLAGQPCMVFPVNKISDGLRQRDQRVDIQLPLGGHRQNGDRAES